MRHAPSRLLLLSALAGACLATASCKKSDDAATAKQAPAVPAPAGGWVEQVARTDEGGYRMGNPQAAVKIIEFGSRTCPHCAAFANEGLPELKQRYIAGGRVSYEFRDYAIHAPDLAAILLGGCNGTQSFFPMLEQMFADFPATEAKLEALPPTFQTMLQGKSPTQQAAAWADQLGYTAFVRERGVPEAKAQACFADSKAIDRLGTAMAAATSRYSITGTPTFVINGTVATGARDWTTLKSAIDAALAG